LKFAGVIDFGIVAAPFVGSLSRFVPSYYYTIQAVIAKARTGMIMAC